MKLIGSLIIITLISIYWCMFLVYYTQNFAWVWVLITAQLTQHFLIVVYYFLNKDKIE